VLVDEAAGDRAVGAIASAVTSATLEVDRCDRVTMIVVMSDVLPLAEVKAKFSEMVDRVEQQHDRITVTRNGRPAAVLMSADDLAALEDTLELLSDPTAMADIERARREVEAGHIVSADEIRAKYLQR
jgi:antitoxin YefM